MKHCVAILVVDLHEDIKVFGSPRLGVESDCIAAHHKVFDLMLVEGGQECDVVWAQTEFALPC